jgi:hypothetical protein
MGFDPANFPNTIGKLIANGQFLGMYCRDCGRHAVIDRGRCRSNPTRPSRRLVAGSNASGADRRMRHRSRQRPASPEPRGIFSLRHQRGAARFRAFLHSHSYSAIMRYPDAMSRPIAPSTCRVGSKTTVTTRPPACAIFAKTVWSSERLSLHAVAVILRAMPTSMLSAKHRSVGAESSY